jgi:hypothetical protein
MATFATLVNDMMLNKMDQLGDNLVQAMERLLTSFMTIVAKTMIKENETKAGPDEKKKLLVEDERLQALEKLDANLEARVSDKVEKLTDMIATMMDSKNEEEEEGDAKEESGSEEEDEIEAGGLEDDTPNREEDDTTNLDDSDSDSSSADSDNTVAKQAPSKLTIVVFEKESIGMQLEPNVNHASCCVCGFLDADDNTPSPARLLGKIEVGDVIVKINSVDVKWCNDAINILTAGKRRKVTV